MASSFMFLFLVSLFIFLGIVWNSSPLSYSEIEVTSSSENNDLNSKSTFAALSTASHLFYHFLKISSVFQIYGFNSNIKGKLKEVCTKEEKIQSVKDASEAQGKVYDELQKQIDGQWLLSKLGLNPNKTMTYVMTIWHQHLSQTLQKKWIPSIKDTYVTLTFNLEPKVQYLTDKSIEMFHASKQALTLHLTQGFDVSYYYLKVIRIMTIAIQHLEKVQVVIRHGFNKLVIKVLRRNNEVK